MKRVVCLLLLPMMVLGLPFMTYAEDLSSRFSDERVPDVLAWNETTSGMEVGLDAPPGPPFYENEIYTLIIWADIRSPKPLGNVSVVVVMGVDTMGPPDEGTSQYYNLSDGVDAIYGWYHSSLMKVTPALSDQQLMGRLTYGNETVNLTYEMDVVPARTALEAHLVVPPDHTGYDELNWTDVQILLVNRGGAGATELVVDLRYAGRVSSTHRVNVVPPWGNATFTAALLPVYGQDGLEVDLVVGPGAPRKLANLTLSVLPRPVLDVMRVEASPEVVASGGMVQIEARVRNRGNATSTGQMVELMVDGSVVHNETVEGLGPGNETTVSAKWSLRGEGLHSVSAIAEGDELAASPVSVEVKAPSPSVGMWTVVLALALVSLAARRSRPDGRA